VPDLAADPDVTPAGTHGGDRSKQVADRHLNTLGSESAGCIVRRLKRDAPELALISSAPSRPDLAPTPPQQR
jgi:hypothetical protein